MSSIISGSSYSSYSSVSPVRSLGEIVFYGSITIPNNFTGELALPVTFTDSPLFIGRLGKFSKAFLTLKYVTISTRKPLTFSSVHHAAIQQKANITIPTGTSNFTFTFNRANGASGAGTLDPTFFQRIGFENTPSTNFAINEVFVQTHNAGNFLDLGYFVPTPIGNAFPPPILLSQYFDPIDGMINFDTNNPGFDVFVQFNNLTGAPVTSVNYVFFGSSYSYDWLQMLVRYRDWRGEIYNAGVFDDSTRIQTFPLGQQVQTPITDPAQTKFGSIIFDPIAFNSFFNPQYTYDVVLSGSIDYFQG